MLKLHIGASRKVPGREPFSSNGFSCSLEVELPDSLIEAPDALRAKTADLFTEARRAVDAQIEGARAAPCLDPRRPPAEDGDGPATNRQLDYVISLARRHRGMSLQELEAFCLQVAGKGDLRALSKVNCSHIIDALKEGDNGDGEE